MSENRMISVWNIPSKLRNFISVPSWIVFCNYNPSNHGKQHFHIHPKRMPKYHWMNYALVSTLQRQQTLKCYLSLLAISIKQISCMYSPNIIRVPPTPQRVLTLQINDATPSSTPFVPCLAIILASLFICWCCPFWLTVRDCNMRHQWSEEAEELLQDCHELVDWNMFQPLQWTRLGVP